MARKVATLIFVEETVKKAKCLACNYCWNNVKPIPSSCPGCGVRLVLRDIKEEIIPLTDAYQKKKASTS